MAIADEINRIKTNITNAYTELENKGATIPNEKNSNNLADAIKSISTGGGLPTKGFIAEEYDSDGYVTKARVVGMTSLPDGALGNYNTTAGSFLSKNLKEVILPSEMTSLGIRCLNACTNLTTINIENITNLGEHCFNNCKSLAIKTLPDSVKYIGQGAFYNCDTVLTQLSIPNAEFIYGESSTGPFRYSTSLKAIWIGSAIETNGLGRYALVTYKTNVAQNSLKYAYIDLPRATVESYFGYTYRFADSVAYGPTIICNDDEGFMTKEEFDAIDWATYTG